MCVCLDLGLEPMQEAERRREGERWSWRSTVKEGFGTGSDE